MSRLAHMAAAAIFTGIMAASLFTLAAAEPGEATAATCQVALCFMAIF